MILEPTSYRMSRFIGLRFIATKIMLYSAWSLIGSFILEEPGTVGAPCTRDNLQSSSPKNWNLQR